MMWQNRQGHCKMPLSLSLSPIWYNEHLITYECAWVCDWYEVKGERCVCVRCILRIKQGCNIHNLKPESFMTF